MDNIDIKDRFLPNGLRLITVKKSGGIVNISVGFKGGASEDSRDKKGLTHFLEHMIFTGTGKRCHDRINEELEFLGGITDAYTDSDTLTLSFTVLREEFKNAAELISDMVRNSVFTETETEREKKVILSEYREGLEDMEIISYDRLYESAFPEDPLKYSVIGNEETITSVTRSDLLRRKKETLRPSNCIIVVVGPEEHYEAEKVVSHYFGDWKEEKLNEIEDEKARVKKENKSLYKGYRKNKNRRGTFATESLNSEMGSVSFLYTFPDLPLDYETPLRIINNRLGDSENSLLFREIRLLRGLSYDVYSSLEISPDFKAVEIYCATDNENLNKVHNLIKKTISGLRTGKHLIGKRNLEIMKKILKTNISALPEDTQGLGNYILSNAQEGKKLLKYVDDLKETSEVTEEKIKKVIDFVFKNPTVHILTGTKKEVNQKL